ncbi:substrate-binding periplasmic protein [Marinobacter zhejiangensis]|uniref:Amino acid ABC transporter substrate-binding protein, PAAT family (TC 3.A.1.3.-) n=1 Tax=Marinobacter zhejiangensis TaxID=488535 RepID=A0A1I4M8L4_9GAMM|nr:transporter substrate-binding domain-containing protein [Marinobacter zhejiangensis]SFL99608.1 amino acid ABC transporter substrate-binding protein, PAAT family (TC 3.A.1.3.-) [Marinobacter zhejiangensis]
MRGLILILGSLMVSLCLAGETVRVGINHAPPYRVVDGDQISGFYVEVFEAIAHRMDWEVQYVEAPFRRILRLMESGEVDVMLGPLRTAERERYMEYLVDAFPPERRLFFYQRPENEILSYHDLRQKRIGVLRGSHYFPAFDDDTGLIKEAGIRYENLVRMLDRDYVDVVIAPELVGLYTLRQENVEAQVSPFFVPGERSWIAVSRKSALMHYQEAIRQSMADIQTQRIYDGLLLEYLQRTTDEE